MQTIQTKMRVRKNHQGILRLPASVVMGDYEVMLIIRAKKRSPKRSVMDILATSSGQRLFKTAIEVDNYLTGEHNAWDS